MRVSVQQLVVPKRAATIDLVPFHLNEAFTEQKVHKWLDWRVGFDNNEVDINRVKVDGVQHIKLRAFNVNTHQLDRIETMLRK